MNLGAFENSNVSAVFDLLRRQAGIRREVVFKLEPLHVGEIDHFQVEVL